MQKQLKKPIRDFALYFSLKSLINLLQSKLSQKVKVNSYDNLKFALSLSLISPLYSILYNLTNSSFLAGSLSSLTLTLDDPSRSSTISQMVFVRVIYFLIRLNIYSKPQPGKPITPKPSKSRIVTSVRNFIHKYGEYTTWSTLAFYITFTCFAHPERVTKSFFNSLIKVTASKERMGPNAGKVVRGLSTLLEGLSALEDRHEMEIVPDNVTSLNHIQLWSERFKDGLLGKALSNLLAILPIPTSIHHSRLICAIQHPQTNSCAGAVVSTFNDVFRGVLPTYIILNTVQIIFKQIKSYYHSKTLKFSHYLYKFITDTFRNTLMVSLYISSFSGYLCLIRLFTREYQLSYGVAGVLAAPAVFVDKPGRLLELNTFCASKVLESLIITSGIRYTRGLEVLVMTPVYGVLAVLMEKYPFVLNGWMTGVFYHIFGIKRV